ncbi:MAG: transporter substrate-binding protein [Ramlibacter sp.]|nr:transporter substrate-binding protein [Ramlibacter sp.]
MRSWTRLLPAIALAAASTLATAEPVTIKYSSWVPPTHWVYTGPVVPYLQEIETVTEGRVKVEVLPKMVGSPQSQFDVVRDGLADMSWIVVGYTPGRFKLAEMGELPFSGDSPGMSAAFHRTYATYFSKVNEFKGVELLGVWAVPPVHIATRTRPVKTLEDFKGLKLRTASDIATRQVTALGGVPILKSSAEAFEMLSSGAIDGSLMIPETVVSTNALGLMRHFTIVPGGLVGVSQAMIINPEVWAKISAKDQAAIRGISGEKLAQRFGEAYQKVNNEAYDAMRKAGYTIQELTPAVLAQFKDKLKSSETDWVAGAKAKGIADPAAALAAYRKEAAKK